MWCESMRGILPDIYCIAGNDKIKAYHYVYELEPFSRYVYPAKRENSDSVMGFALPLPDVPIDDPFESGRTIRVQLTNFDYAKELWGNYIENLYSPKYYDED